MNHLLPPTKKMETPKWYSPLWDWVRYGWARVTAPSSANSAQVPAPSQSPRPSTMILVPDAGDPEKRLAEFARRYDLVASDTKRWPDWLRGTGFKNIGRRVALAQFVLETGWGSSDSYRSRNNAFGMRPSSRNMHSGVSASGLAIYPTVEQSIADYLARQVQFDGYETAFTTGKNQFSRARTVDQYLAGLVASKYAEDPQYAQKLKTILASPQFRRVVPPFSLPLQYVLLALPVVGLVAYVGYVAVKSYRKGGRK